MNVAAHLPILAIAVPLLGAFALPLFGKLHRRARDLWAVLVGAATVALVVALAIQVFTTGIQVYALGGLRPTQTTEGGFPIRIVLVVDGMGAFMALISALVGLVSLMYTFWFLPEEEGKTLAMTLFFLLWAGMLGMEFTGDMFNFFVFLEVTGIAACALIGYRTWESAPAEAAFKTMIMYTLSGLFVLLAVGLLYGEYGGLNIAYLSSKIGGSQLDKIALGLLLTGLATKAGAIPMHMWIPDAYGEAPAPISAVLVANSQVGLYGLYRVCFTLYGSGINALAVGWIIIILGVLSMFIGVMMALIQKDIKRVMAFHAVSQTGYMLLGVGVGLAVSNSEAAMGDYGLMAMEGGIFHMLNHAVYKGLLFLTAGAIFYRTGTRKLDELGGLGHNMFFTSIFFLIAAAAIAGLPPFNGFASKLMIYESVFKFNPLLSIIAMIVSIFTLASFVKVFQSAFLGPKQPRYTEVREAPSGMLIAMGTLALIVIVLGLFPRFFVYTIVAPAAEALWEGRDLYLAAVLGG
jgi:multicomponent Na+:H+ antiporter subunit D